MKFKGLIFDFNGVLWFDNHLQEQAWKQFSTAVRGLPLSTEEMAVHVHGRNNPYTMEYLTRREIKGAELDQLIQQKETIYRQLCLEQGQNFKLSPGAIPLLEFLVAHHIPHTIATASEKTNLNFFIQHLHLDQWFEIDQIVYDNGRRPGKPAPDIYLQAAANLKLTPAECMVIEDSHSGLEAAYAAGIGYIVALGPASKHTQLARFAGVNRVIESLQQLPKEELFL